MTVSFALCSLFLGNIWDCWRRRKTTNSVQSEYMSVFAIRCSFSTSLLNIVFCCCSDYHKKQNTLFALRKKAQEKNPDEFYHKMISSKLEVTSIIIVRATLHRDITWGFHFCPDRGPLWQDGVHVMKKKQQEVEVTEEQKKVMRTQDIRYVEMKRVAEAKVCYISLDSAV